MKFKLTPMVAGFCLLGLTSTPAFAATDDNEQRLIEKLSEQTAALQKEVATLQSQVKALRKTQSTEAVSSHRTGKVHKIKAESGTIPTQSVFQNADIQKRPVTGERADRPLPLHSLTNEPLYIGGMPLVNSPFLGERSAFDGSDLIVSLPSVGEDLRLIQQRDKIYSMYKNYGIAKPNDPFIDISGGIEAQYINQRPYTGNKTSDIDLTRGEIDFVANINRWTTGYVSFNYDNAAPSMGQRVNNARLYMDKGFITIGNFDKSPLYGTIGQFYVPFGRYSSYMISDTLPKLLARIKSRAALLGYDNIWHNSNELNISAFTFKGDSKTHADESKLNQLGVNADYSFTQSNWNGAIGGSVISNIADSLGMQGNAASNFNGFSNSSEVLVRRVPAYDLHGSLGFGAFSFLTEYVQAFHDFSPLNLSYKGHGAKPAAFNVEGAYSFHIYDKPTSIAVGYGRTKDALALLLPQQRYLSALNICLWKNTIETLEYRHDINYPGSAYATGQGLAIGNTGAGHSSDTLTLQLGVYF